MRSIAQPTVANAYVRFITEEPDVDWVVVDRLIAGIPVRSNSAERVEAVARMTRYGMSALQIAERMHCTPRSVTRARAVAA